MLFFIIPKAKSQQFEWEQKLFNDSLSNDSIFNTFSDLDALFSDSTYLFDSTNGYKFYHRTKLKALSQIGSDKGFRPILPINPEYYINLPFKSIRIKGYAERNNKRNGLLCARQRSKEC